MLAIPLLFLAIVILLPAFGVTVWALRGRRIDDHPLCRRCGFDLTGRPDTSMQCAECGADVTRPGAVRVGHWRVRRGLAVAAGLVAGLCIGVVIVLGVMVARGVNWTPYMPTAWLGRDLLSTVAAARAAALGELSARGASPGRAALLAVADRLLAAQGDAKVTWPDEAGRYLDGLRVTQLLDDGRYLRYLRQGVIIDVRARPRVRIGDPIPIRFMPLSRTAPNSPLSLGVRYSIVLPEVTLQGDRHAMTLWNGRGNGSTTPTVRPGKAEVALLRPGVVEADLAVEIDVYETAGYGVSPSAVQAPLTHLTAHTKQAIEFLPSGADDIAAVRGGDLEARVRAAIQRPTFQPPDPAERYLNGQIEFKAVPEDLAFSVVALFQGREFPMGQMSLSKGGGSTSYGFGGRVSVDGQVPGEIDLLLRPNADAARNTIGEMRYADVEVRFDHVLVPPPPATQPSAASQGTGR